MKNLLVAALLSLAPAVPAVAQDQPRPAKVFTIAEQVSDVTRRYPAIVLPSQEVELSFRIGGNLVELPIRGATEVVKGDVIGKLDTRDLEQQAAQLQSQIDQAEAQLAALKAGARAEEIASMEAAVEAAQAELDQARDQAERSRQLAQRGTIATATLDQDEANLRVAQANLRNQQESLAIGLAGGRAEDVAASEAAIRGIEAQLQSVRDSIDDATLRAPFAGIIARRDVENFTNVQAGQSIGLLQALAVVHFAFDVPASDVTALTAGGRDNITNRVQMDALPGMSFDAETVEFSVQADTSTQTYRGRVAVEVPGDALILPGMVGTVISSAPGTAPALRVPLTAIDAGADGAAKVWTVDDGGQVSETPVELGEIAGAFVEVKSGVAAGDTIVSAGVSKLIPGMIVRPVTQIGG
ncbi:MAG: efflux RND transporter periplasmic adaptor subunit [Pseudomonadota bacterium]